MVKGNRMIVVLAGGVAGVAVAVASAGPLNPPSGPVAPTYKTLTEVEPRIAVQSLAGDALALHVITQPGSYYLTGDLVGVPGKHAIRVEASDVTFDLMGFTIAGSPGGQQANDGAVLAAFAYKNLVVRNGTLRGWSGGGTQAGGVRADLATNCRLEGLRVAQCSPYGLSAGPGAVVTGCLVEGGSHGIRVVSAAVVSECVARSMTGRGIDCEGDDGLIVNCQVTGAGPFGIRIGGSGTVRGCEAALCSGTGIQVGSGSVVTDCAASTNGATGIHATGQSTITGCVAELNWFDGITVASDSLVTGNNSHANGQAPTNHAGIFVAGSDNRIEGNTCTDNNFGVYTETNTTNLVIRNSARANSSLNFRFGAGTVAGPVVTAATIATSSNPHANYEF